METICDPLKIKKTLMHLGCDSLEFSEHIRFAEGIVIAWRPSDINFQDCIKEK